MVHQGRLRFSKWVFQKNGRKQRLPKFQLAVYVVVFDRRHVATNSSLVCLYFRLRDRWTTAHLWTQVRFGPSPAVKPMSIRGSPCRFPEETLHGFKVNIQCVKKRLLLHCE